MLDEFDGYRFKCTLVIINISAWFQAQTDFPCHGKKCADKNDTNKPRNL